MQSVVKQTLIFMEIKQHTFRVISESSIFMHTIKQDTLHLVVIMSDFILGGSKITADSDCSHEIKRYLLLGRKVTTSLDSILKSRDSTLPAKGHIVEARVFSVAMYGCESRTIKKTECQRIDALKQWCWRRLLRVPWTAGDQISQS